MSSALSANFDRSKFYLPMFHTYADYDFRNDQAIDMLEELVWENSYSGYNFYDYMALSKDVSAGSPSTPKDLTLEKEFHASNMDVDLNSSPLTNKPLKDLTLTGSYYSSSVQLEDYAVDPASISTQKFALFPLHAELSEIDDSFNSFKGLNALFAKFSNPVLGTTSFGTSTRSYISVFNNFRSDFEDFS